MKAASDPRHKRREYFVKELFALSFHPDQKISEKVRLVMENRDTIDTRIAQAAPEWPVEKIAKIDLSILRLAIYELVCEHKEPPKVIIDEAVELAKSYGGEGSPGFINGVLGTIYSSLNKNSTKQPMDLRPKIIQAIADHFGIPKEELNDNVDIHTDLNATAMELEDFYAKLERIFTITIDEEERENFQTVGDIITTITEQHDEFHKT